MIEADFTSVSGIIYMSLTESKINYQYDDRDIDVADTDRLVFPTLDKLYTVGDKIIPNFNEDTFNEWEVELIPPENCPYVSFNANDGYLYAVAPGQVII